jgi:hypothetical protein
LSRRADIDFVFQEPVTVASVLRVLGPTGWGPVEPLGVSFFIEEDGDIDWERGAPEDVQSIVARLDAPENAESAIGLSLYSQVAERGGSLLFFSGRTQVSFSPTIERKPLMDESPRMTDIAWYLDQFIRPLVAIGLSGYEARDLVD